MRPSRVLWWVVLAELLAVVVLPPLRQPYVVARRVLGSRQPAPPSRARVEQLNTAWAWAGYADQARFTPDQRWEAFERARELAPNDPLLLLRRASAIARATDGLAAQVLPAARAAVEAAPDNGYAHYLLAAALAHGGQPAEALAEVRRGNAAPHLVSGREQAARWRARLADDDYAGLDFSGHLDEFKPLREMTRQLAKSGPPADRLALARCGERLRDDGDTLIAALVGLAIESIAFTSPGYKPLKGEPLPEMLKRRADGFAAELRAAGLTAEADEVARQAKRSTAAKLSISDYTRHRRALGGPLGRLLAWLLWQAVLLLAAPVTLVSLLPGGRRDHPPASWRDLARPAECGLLPALAVVGCAVASACPRLTSNEPSLWLLALLAAPLLPAVAVRASLGRRGGWRPVGAALVPALLVLALAASGPLAWCARGVRRMSLFAQEHEYLVSVARSLQ